MVNTEEIEGSSTRAPRRRRWFMPGALNGIGVGDGAPWIADQVDLRFGPQADFLIDFYHLCEYLSSAGEKIAGRGKGVWMETQKNLLKENRLQEVLEGLRPFLENNKVSDSTLRFELLIAT